MAAIRAKKQKNVKTTAQAQDKLIETNPTAVADTSHGSLNSNNSNNVTSNVTLDVNALLSGIRKQVESQNKQNKS